MSVFAPPPSVGFFAFAFAASDPTPGLPLEALIAVLKESEPPLLTVDFRVGVPFDVGGVLETEDTELGRELASDVEDDFGVADVAVDDADDDDDDDFVEPVELVVEDL